jgi:hypothetical protein
MSHFEFGAPSDRSGDPQVRLWETALSFGDCRQFVQSYPRTPFRALLAELLVGAAVLASEPPQHGPDLRSFVGRIVEVGCTEPPFPLARHRKRLLSERTAVRIWLSVFPSGE